MKKLSHSQKRHLLARQRYEYRKKKRTSSKSTSGYSNNYNSLYSRFREYREPVKRVFRELPPVDFNLQQDNCVKVISYVNSIKKAASKGWDVVIDLSRVIDIREGAITMLLSVIKEITHSQDKVHISGYMPRDTVARTTLGKSGFLKFVRTPTNYRFPESKNVLRTGKKGNPSAQLGSDVRDSMMTVWGAKGRNPALRAAIFEMIRNSCDHAFTDSKELSWHLSISHDEKKRLVKFSFVDNGSGILSTMRKPLKDVLNFFKDDSDILETAFMGKIESRTKLPWRGKGLPAIFENVLDGYFKNLLVISNGVFMHMDSGTKIDMRIEFEGTYYYWEIDESCKKVCFQD